MDDLGHVVQFDPAAALPAVQARGVGQQVHVVAGLGVGPQLVLCNLLDVDCHVLLQRHGMLQHVDRAGLGIFLLAVAGTDRSADLVHLALDVVQRGQGLLEGGFQGFLQVSLGLLLGLLGHLVRVAVLLAALAAEVAAPVFVPIPVMLAGPRHRAALVRAVVVCFL